MRRRRTAEDMPQRKTLRERPPNERTRRNDKSPTRRKKKPTHGKSGHETHQNESHKEKHPPKPKKGITRLPKKSQGQAKNVRLGASP
jgi:hypothetical protein